ncbi:unnamed protein product, partial [Rodentolepis nana]|uniref:Zinc finger protein n=1 Tax=Rodentolepis nana TaxID=102285 RepID=A0A158QJ71_RODNA
VPSETVVETEDPITQQTESSTSSAGNSSNPQNVFFCRVCKLYFRTRERLLRHEKKSAVHNRRQLNRCKRLKLSPVPENSLGRPWECKECGLMYTRKHGLERHIAFVHHGETAFRCEFCNFHALDRANFRQHMSRHFHLKNFACEHCDHRCITKQELEDHVRFKHSDKRDFKCPDCEATFKTPGTLSRHQKTHTNVSYLCNQCSASFNRMSNLKRHKETLHSSSAENRRNRGRPKKDATSRQKQLRKATPNEQQQGPQKEQHQGHLSVVQGAIEASGLESMWDYEATRIHSASEDQLCTTVTSTAVIDQPVYLVTFETESGWIPASSVVSATNLTDESLPLHLPPPSSQLPNQPPPRSDTVLPCVSDFFSSFLTSGPTTASNNVQHQSPSHPTNAENVHHQSAPSNHQHHHIWRSDGDMVDDLANGSAVGTDDLICDFLNCEVVTAEEDVEASGCSENAGTNFSVGYLIGGGAGGSGNGIIEQGGSRAGEELHTLPTSDCLSLVPIVTTAFEDSSSAGINNNAQVHGTSAFHPFWTSISSSGSAGECAANAQSGIIHEGYEEFEQHENDM